MKALIISTAFLLLSLFISAQCMLRPISLDERIANSAVIIEGEVRSSEAFLSAPGVIKTKHLIEVYTVYKGNVSSNTLALVTPGGYLGNEFHTVTPSLTLQSGASGIFFLAPVTNETSTFRPYAGPQGFIQYDFQSGGANDPFNDYSLLPNQEIAQKCNTKPVVISKLNRPVLTSNTTKSGPISGIQPTTITAGTKSILTITGSGFGATRGTGKIVFPSASSGPAEVNPVNSEYISWKDNEIKVKVPSGAGTGKVTVSKSGNSVSLETLTITYAQLNVVTFSGAAFQVAHINDNSNGGYTYFTSPVFNANTAATSTFVRAMTNWRNATCVNWEMGGSTPGNSTAQDGTNIVRFGDPGELPEGVLAVTNSYYNSCSGSQVWYVNELDITYAPDINWNFGSGSPKFGEYDMESVTIHELGHAHQLGHVIDEDDIMHRAIGPQVRKRDLSATNGAAGKFVQAQSLTKNTCGPTPMTNFPGCTATGIETAEESSSPTTLYPNPAQHLITISPTWLALAAGEVLIMDMRGKEIIRKRVSSNQNSVSTEALANGIYLLKLAVNGENKFSELVLVQH
jgi:hypothetical protein